VFDDPPPSGSLEPVRQLAEAFLLQHHVRARPSLDQGPPLTGGFSLHRGRTESDLYGMIDAVYVLYTLGRLAALTDQDSRRAWAKQILACQDDRGWFSRRNLRRHADEHATAYAVGALRLLEMEEADAYVSRMRPITGLLSAAVSREGMARWLRRMGLRFDPDDPVGGLGWHYLWRGSHIGGGVGATVAMLGELLEEWWPGRLDRNCWLGWYFDWLDAHASPRSGYWQRAFWNLVYREPTLIDLGGAVHFLWVYAAAGRPFPYPEATLHSTLGLQRETGLYREHPFCIDLDGAFCVVRSYLQLSADQQSRFQEAVHRCAKMSFTGIVVGLLSRPLSEVYGDTHGLPGALAALVEWDRLPGFRHAELLTGWQHVLDRVCWL
jgi:hypothetical protein